MEEAGLDVNSIVGAGLIRARSLHFPHRGLCQICDKWTPKVVEDDQNSSNDIKDLIQISSLTCGVIGCC